MGDVSESIAANSAGTSDTAIHGPAPTIPRFAYIPRFGDRLREKEINPSIHLQPSDTLWEAVTLYSTKDELSTTQDVSYRSFTTPPQTAQQVVASSSRVQCGSKLLSSAATTPATSQTPTDESVDSSPESRSAQPATLPSSFVKKWAKRTSGDIPQRPKSSAKTAPWTDPEPAADRTTSGSERDTFAITEDSTSGVALTKAFTKLVESNLDGVLLGAAFLRDKLNMDRKETIVRQLSIDLGLAPPFAATSDNEAELAAAKAEIIALKMDLKTEKQRHEMVIGEAIDHLYERGTVNDNCPWCSSLRDLLTHVLVPIRGLEGYES